MPVKEGDYVKVLYTGTLDDGTVFDSSDMHGGEPLQFDVGTHKVIPGFEKAVIGKEVGDEFKIRLEPSEAYGEHDPKGVMNVPKDQFPKDQNPQVGMMLQLMGPNGEHAYAWITDIKENEITLDQNHPMAGKALNFELKIIESGESTGECNDSCCDDCGHDHQDHHCDSC